jgi:CubicO group peptidase (beta-lactamase class C family)
MNIRQYHIVIWLAFSLLLFCTPSLSQNESADIDQTNDNSETAALEENQTAAEETEKTPENIDQLKRRIADIIKKRNVPAVGIAMIDATGPVWIGALGLANLENQTKANENSLFRIGSTSKMFVSLSILKLVEQGKLSLEDRIIDLIPEIKFENQWRDSDPVRVVHLLEHTTGWDDIHLAEYAHNDPTPATLRQGLDYHPDSRVSRWIPGSRMSYCNSGPPVAAFIVEKITGKSFEDYVQENFFDPMGMQTASYFLSEDVVKHGVTLYDPANKPQDYWHIIMRPSGSINASAVDMSKFLQFYINRGAVNNNQLVSQQSLERMEIAKSTNAAKVGQQYGYGLSNYSSPHKSWVYREHNGGVNGGLTELAYLPSENLGHVIMTNSGNSAAFGEISDLIRDYETRLLEEKQIESNSEINEQHKELEGLYFPINPRQNLTAFLDRITGIQKVEFSENRMVRQGLLGGSPIRYIPLSNNLYQSEKTGLVSLSVANDPLVGQVIHANNLVLQPTSALIVFVQLAILSIWIISIISSLIYLFVWAIRKLDGKVPGGATIRIRLWPLLSAISIIFFIVFFIQGSSDPFESLGVPSFVSVGIMLSTLFFALFALLGVYTAVKERNTAMNRVNYWYSSISSITHLIVVLYFWSFGIIGLMTWG